MGHHVNENEKVSFKLKNPKFLKTEKIGDMVDSYLSTKFNINLLNTVSEKMRFRDGRRTYDDGQRTPVPRQ